MFREIRRKEREIPKNKALEILLNGEYGVLSTIGEDNYPYGIPLNYVLYDNKVYFHCAIEGYKLNNIKYNNRVSFCVVGRTEVLSNKFSTDYESVILFGKCSEVYNEEKELGLYKLIEKYSKEFKKEGLNYIKNAINKTKVFKIEIEHITGKSRR